MAEPRTIPTMQTPLVSVKGVSKTFGGIRALDDVSFDLYSEDVVGLVGDNGAGKSTLIKILSGAHRGLHLARSSSKGRRSPLHPPSRPSGSASRRSTRTCR